jgi:DNA primase
MQLEMLWRMVEVPVLCFDGDAAGQRAAMRAIERALPILKSPNSLKFVTLPFGKDPDDILKQDGTEAFAKVLGNATSLVQYIWERESSFEPLTTPEAKAHLRSRLVAHANAIQDAELSRLYRRELLDTYYREVYPKRDFSSRSVDHGRISPDVITKLRNFLTNGSREELLTAILVTLASRPSLISLERIAKLERYDPKTNTLKFVLDVFVDSFDASEDDHELPLADLEEISSWRSTLSLPHKFVSDSLRDQEVSPSLDAALLLLVDLPEIEANLEQATALYSETLSDEDAYIQKQYRDAREAVISRVKKIGFEPA